MQFTLPYPPSANHYWRTTRNGRIYKTAAAKDYAWHVIAASGGRDPLSGDIALQIDVYRPRKSGDLDNRLKVTLDSLQGVAYRDDNQIVEIHARRFDDKDNPRVEVTVRSLSA